MAFFGRPSARVPVSSTGNPAEERAAAETLAELLRTFGQFAFDTLEHRAGQLRTECEEWAQRALVGVPKRPALQGLATNPAKPDWTRLLHFFVGTRDEESRGVTTMRTQLAECVQSFGRVVQEMVCSRRALDDDLLDRIDGLQRSLDGSSNESVAEAARRLVAAAGAALDGAERQTSERHQQLAGRLERLVAAGAGTSVGPSLDPVTRLHTREAFLEHGAFLATVAKFVVRPSTLHLFAASEPSSSPDPVEADAVALAVADQLVRVFYSQDQFVARLGPFDFGVVSAGLRVEQAHALTEQAARVLNDARRFELGFACVTVPTTAEEGWEAAWERADSALRATSARSVELVALPAAFA